MSADRRPSRDRAGSARWHGEPAPRVRRSGCWQGVPAREGLGWAGQSKLADLDPLEDRAVDGRRGRRKNPRTAATQRVLGSRVKLRRVWRRVPAPSRMPPSTFRSSFVGRYFEPRRSTTDWRSRCATGSALRIPPLPAGRTRRGERQGLGVQRLPSSGHVRPRRCAGLTGSRHRAIATRPLGRG